MGASDLTSAAIYNQFLNDFFMLLTFIFQPRSEKSLCFVQNAPAYKGQRSPKLRR